MNAVPDQAEEHDRDQAGDHAEPDPQGDPTDLAATRHELGGPGQEERHQQQGHRTAEADTRARDAGHSRGAGSAQPGGRDGWHVWAFRTSGCDGPVSPVTSVTEVAARRGARDGTGRAGTVCGMADRPGRDTERADEPGYDWLYGTRRKGVGGQPPSPRRRRRHPGAADPLRGRQVGSPRPRADPDAAHGGPTGQLALEWLTHPFGWPVRDPAAGPSALRTRVGSGRLRSPPGRTPAAVETVPRPATVPSRLAQAGSGGVAGLPGRRAPPGVVQDRQGRRDADRRPSRSQPGTTYLLVGSDSREGLTRKQQLAYGVGKGQGRRTDTIMLLHTGSGPTC